MKQQERLATVTEAVWVTPSVRRIRFKTEIPIEFNAGQFFTLLIPASRGIRLDRRCFSFSNSPEKAVKEGYEFHVRVVNGGKGSRFISNLQPGDSLWVAGAFGEFQYKPQAQRNVVFIATSTGLAPLKSIVSSGVFQNNRPDKAMLLYGVRQESELIPTKDFKNSGVEVVPCVSRPIQLTEGFWGRVTDYLRRGLLPVSFADSDFYIAGTEEMVQEVVEYLTAVGVSMSRIHTEHFRKHLLSPPPEGEMRLIPIEFRKMQEPDELDLKKAA